MKEKPVLSGCQLTRGGSADAKEITKAPEEIERHRQRRMKAIKKLPGNWTPPHG